MIVFIILVYIFIFLFITNQFIIGEADGRMYESGTFHECLLGHAVECSDTCPQYVPKSGGEFERSDSCLCD